MGEPDDPSRASSPRTWFVNPEVLELEERIDVLETSGRREDAEPLKKRRDELAALFPLWEENLLSWRAFLKVRTQWRTGMSGATGLDFNAVDKKISRFARIEKLDQDAEDRLFDDLDLMECMIVAEWAKLSEKRAQELEVERSRGGRR